MMALARFFMRMSMWVSGTTGHPWYEVKAGWHGIVDEEADRVFEDAEDGEDDAAFEDGTYQEYPVYRCGNTPKVGDLVEFGTRCTRYIVTGIQDDCGPFTLYCGEYGFLASSLKLMKLVARHGQADEASEDG